MCTLTVFNNNVYKVHYVLQSVCAYVVRFLIKELGSLIFPSVQQYFKIQLFTVSLGMPAILQDNREGVESPHFL